MINHRYRIVRMLGEGGSGAVYLVEDQLLGNHPAALKAFHKRSESDEQGDRTFRNEVGSLLRLHHPHLVRIYDFGTIRHAVEPSLRDRLFLTMEYVQGRDILAWLSSVSDTQARAHLLETLLLQALGVLSYVHSEGVIHFDIKPQNFVVLGSPIAEPSPFLRLIDFGLSAGKDTSLGGPVRGTLQYAAPELLQGKAADFRADLYSLGATFFRLLEGHSPFEAPSSVELVKKVLNEEPHFSDAAMRYPPALIDVIGTLIRKEPGERFQTALEAAHVLMAGREGDLWKQFAFTKRSHFVGRGPERERIDAALAGLSAGTVSPGESVILVSGAAGTGKTDLLAEASKTARIRGIVVAETAALRDEVPFRSLTPVLRLLMVEAKLCSPEGCALVERYEKVFERQAGKAAEGGVEKLVAQRARFIVECASLFPIAIVADDLAGIDQASLQVLQTVARDMPAGRLMIVASERGPSAQLFPVDDAIEIRLGELTRAEVEEMCLSVFGQYPGAKVLGGGVHQYYGGIPAVVAEALHTLTEVVPDEAITDGRKAEEFVHFLREKLPATSEDFFITHYHKVSREKQLILAVLSCFKYPAPGSILGAVLPIQKDRLNALTRLLEFDGYVGSLDNHARLFIRLDGLKGAVYDSIAPERAGLHASIAAAMNEQLVSPSFTDLQELARQFLAGGNAATASQYFEKAAEEGVRVLAFPRAAELLKDAIASGGTTPPARRNALGRKLSEVLFHAGRYDEAISVAQEVRDSPDAGTEVDAALSKIMGLAQSRLGDFDEARSNLLGALAASTDPLEQIELRQELVGIEISVGRFQDAERESLSQLQKIRDMPQSRLQAAIYIDLGIATFLQNRFDDSILHFHSALDTYSRLEDFTGVINAMMNLGNVLSAKGETDRAISFWNDALKMSRQHGTLNQQAQLQNNLGIAHYRLKKYDLAKVHYHQALDISTRIRAKAGRAYALSNLGETLLAEGEYESALNSLNEAHDLYSSMGDAQGIGETGLLLAQLWLTVGVPSSAAQSLETAEKQPHSGGSSFEGQCSYLRGILLLKQGEQTSARESLGKAQALFQAAGEPARKWKALFRFAESLLLEGKPREARDSLLPFFDDSESRSDPQLLAEAFYLLASAKKAIPDGGGEKPITLFKKALAAVEQEHVSEITWKIAYALAREYHQRGQRIRAREHLLKTRLVLKLFLSYITSPDLKTQYLSSDERHRVLSTTERLLYT